MCGRCLRRPVNAGKRNCENCFDYIEKYRQERKDKRAREKATAIDSVQESDEQRRIEAEPEGDEMVVDDSEVVDEMVMDGSKADDNDIVVDDVLLGHSTDRMAIDYIVN